MKRTITATWTILISVLLCGQTPSNSVSVTCYSSSSAGATDITYHDGLGTAVSEVSLGAGTSAAPDVVRLTGYDSMRRPARGYLPYPSPSNQSGISSTAAQSAYYASSFPGSSEVAYTLTEYEDSPQGRVVSVRRPGEEYADPERRTVYEYGLNTDADSVLVLDYQPSPSASISVGASYRPSGSLSRVTVTDEDGRSVTSFTDVWGRTVLERRGGDLKLDTYYVYDLKDSLVCVIQPEGSHLLTRGGSYGFESEETVMKEFSFLNWYDGRGRLIKSKIPGAGCCDYIYDRRGRLRFSRDGNILASGSGRWMYYEYDIYDCLTKKALVDISLTGDQLETFVMSDWSSPLSAGSLCEVLSLTGFPDVEWVAVLEEHRYDRVGYHPAPEGSEPLPPVPSYLSFERATNAVSGVPDTATTGDLGVSLNMEYYSKVMVLPPDGQYSSASFVERACYYDTEGRVLQIVESDGSTGMTTRTSFKYDLSDNVLSSQETVTHSGGSTTKLTVNGYDSRGRITQERVYANGALSPTSVTNFAYDALGRSSSVSAFGVTTSRTYTLQGQPSVIQTRRPDGSNVYHEELRYTAPSHSTPLYSGGISEIESRTGTTFVATDAFEYDGAGRLAGNARYVGQSLTSSYSEGGISYDRNGNMKTISRYGESGVTPVQDFSYVLAGNRVSRIAGTSDTYRYDANGNMTHDPYRNRDISYNAIGRVSLVTDMEPAPVCRIGWTADGVKCSTVAENGSGLVYAGDMVFSRTSSGALSFESMPFAAGRLGSDLVPVFYAKDHLGSTRAMIKGGTVIEEDDYYPYGGRRDIQSMDMLSTNRYRFSGKETLSGFGIDYMDFGARLYDPVICRWLSQDPLAFSTPSVSPYSYCAGDPVNFVDPDGEDVWEINNQGVVVNHTFCDYIDVIVVYYDDSSSKSMVFPANTLNVVSNIGESFNMNVDMSFGRWIFYFLSENTNVEMGLIEGKNLCGSGANDAIVFTDSHKSQIDIYQRIKELNLDDMSVEVQTVMHSHPNQSEPSGYRRKINGSGDKFVHDALYDLLGYNPIQCVFFPKVKKLIQYDSKFRWYPAYPNN